MRATTSGRNATVCVQAYLQVEILGARTHHSRLPAHDLSVMRRSQGQVRVRGRGTEWLSNTIDPCSRAILWEVAVGSGPKPLEVRIASLVGPPVEIRR